ncbi:pre-mRNA-splicing factor 38B-like [Papaver somniferum]|uniref:pre-mRNA-splicing factor 38B-like n=1 Tax=Papaver somniferum TaxID=3469 RepID=UPI000E6F5635|nr:pre-mRNA-splicing factor 38B-like [Papaver somniferum]
MVRIESVVDQGMTTRRSHRFAERRRITNLEQQEERMEENQRTEIPIGSQREQGQNNEIDYDRVSVHAAKTNSTNKGQRIGNEEPITASEGNMTIAELSRANTNCEREEEDPKQGQMLLHGREMLRDEYERERDIERARGRQRRREELEERELQSGLRHIDNRERGRKRHLIDDIDQGRVTPQERKILRHRYDRTCNEERHDRVQIEANNERRRRTRDETEQQEIQEAIRQKNHENRLRQGGNTSLLPRLTNAVASASQGNQGRSNAEMEQKLVAMRSEDKEEFDYRDKQLQKYIGVDANQPGSSTGQQTHYNKKVGILVWE